MILQRKKLPFDSTTQVPKQSVLIKKTSYFMLFYTPCIESVTKVRLADGGSSYGRVEVYQGYYGWGTVCDDDWSMGDGNVVCRQLGFSRATKVHGTAYYGQGSGPILLDNLKCHGNEASLFVCVHNGLNVEDCSHKEDASVICTH